MARRLKFCLNESSAEYFTPARINVTSKIRWHGYTGRFNQKQQRLLFCSSLFKVAVPTLPLVELGMGLEFAIVQRPAEVPLGLHDLIAETEQLYLKGKNST